MAAVAATAESEEDVLRDAALPMLSAPFPVGDRVLLLIRHRNPVVLKARLEEGLRPDRNFNPFVVASSAWFSSDPERVDDAIQTFRLLREYGYRLCDVPREFNILNVVLIRLGPPALIEFLIKELGANPYSGNGTGTPAAMIAAKLGKHQQLAAIIRSYLQPMTTPEKQALLSASGYFSECLYVVALAGATLSDADPALLRIGWYAELLDAALHRAHRRLDAIERVRLTGRVLDHAGPHLYDKQLAVVVGRYVGDDIPMRKRLSDPWRQEEKE